MASQHVRDIWGSRTDTQCHMINHVLFTAKKALTVAAVATITGLSDKRVRNHFVYLAQRGLITY